MPPRSISASMRYRDSRTVSVMIMSRPGARKGAGSHVFRSTRRALGLRAPTDAGQRPGLAEAVAHRAHRLDQPRVLLAELRPEPPDVDVDRPRPAVVLVAPYPRQELLAGEHLARMCGEEPKQLVLHVGEVERTVPHGGLVRLEVEHEVAVVDELRPGVVPRPPAQV